MTKYSIKNICLGIGIGLIIASAANISVSPASLSREQIEREAKKHGLIVMEAKEMIQKQPSQEAPSPQAPAENELPKPGESVEITIQPGAVSENIAELLINSKLIINKQDFLNRLSELKKENKVQVGTFNIPEGSSLDEIVNIITSTPR